MAEPVYDEGVDARPFRRSREEIVTEDGAGACDPDDRNAAEYASSVSLSRMLYGENLLEWISQHRPGVTTERQSVGPVLFPQPTVPGQRRITVVRAPMGSGKTTALIEWLRSALRGPDMMSALVVSCRRSFTHTLARRFNDAGLVGFVTYFSSADYIIRGDHFKRLMVQAESLHRVDRSLLESYDVLVLDEAMSTVGQLYSPTMKRLKAVDDALTNLLTTCPTVLAMDATINAQFVDAICELRGEENVHVIVGEYASPGFSRRRCTVLRSLGAELLVPRQQQQGLSENRDDGFCLLRQRASFFSELGRRLADGLNVCVFSSTLAFSETAAAFCRNITSSVLLLNSESQEQVDVTTWSSYRAVIYTTVVTVGLSFDGDHFHSMFAYVKPSGHGPDMAAVYQSLGRVRSLILDETLLYVDGSSSRCDGIFTPMLLNHVVSKGGSGGGGWPTSFVQVTNAACCAFRRDCAPAFSEASADSYLFRKFKYKHLFERCTLASLGDSINILHALLESNRIDVKFDGCGLDGRLTADDFATLLRDVRADSLKSQRLLREARDAAHSRCHDDDGNGGEGSDDSPYFLEVDEACDPSQIPSPADEDRVMEFADKYLKPSVPPEDLTDVLHRMRDPIFRDRFANVSVLRACLEVPLEERDDDTLDAAYRVYGTGKFPFYARDGTLSAVEMPEDHNAATRRDAYRSCAMVADALGWNPISEETGADATPEAIWEAVTDVRESFRRLLMEIPRCYATDRAAAVSKPARRVASVLNGTPAPTSISGDKDYCVSLFKVVWEEMFGAHLSKSTRTFPGSTKVKNLRKAELEKLLDDVGVRRDGLGTHKQLYSALMANKAAFSRRRYRIKRPKWYRLLKSPYERRLSTGNPFSSPSFLSTEGKEGEKGFARGIRETENGGHNNNDLYATYQWSVT